jgi:hypothetical protein
MLKPSLHSYLPKYTVVEYHKIHEIIKNLIVTLPNNSNSLKSSRVTRYVNLPNQYQWQYT